MRAMRLVVPTCLCLMAWTTVTGFESSPSMEEAGGVTVVAKNHGPRLPPGKNLTLNRVEIEPQQDSTTGIAEGDGASSTQAETVPSGPPVPPRAAGRQEVCETLALAAQTNGLPVPFFLRLILQESNFNPKLVSRAGAQGVAQFMPGTAAERGLADPFDPLQALPASARMLRDLFEQFGNLGLAAAAYNAGPRRILAWLARRGKLPDETRSYVRIVTGKAPEHWKGTNPADSDLSVPAHAPCQREAGYPAISAPFKQPRLLTAAIKPARAKLLSAIKRQTENSRLAKKNFPAKRTRVVDALADEN